MDWLRLYHALLGCRKLQSLPDREFKAWINMLLVASKTTPRGSLPSISDLAFSLRLREDFVIRLIAKFKRECILDEVNGVLFMHDWAQWQFKSDDINQRVAEHRKRQRNVTRNVSGNVACNGAEAEADTDTDTEQASSSRKPDPPTRPHVEYPLAAAAMREKYPTPATLVENVVKKTLATAAAVRGPVKISLEDVGDSLIAEAVAAAWKPTQNSPALFLTTVPELIEAWMQQGKKPPGSVTTMDRGYEASLAAMRRGGVKHG